MGPGHHEHSKAAVVESREPQPRPATCLRLVTYVEMINGFYSHNGRRLKNGFEA